MSSLSQLERVGRFNSVLGPDALFLERFSGTDRLNGLYRYDVSVISTDQNVDPNALLGTHGTVVLEIDGPTYFDGIITSFRWAGESSHGNNYNLTLEPFLKVAGMRRTQRIFHKMTPAAIIEKVINEGYKSFGSPLVKNDLSDPGPELEYTVQYDESDLNFILRMMQRFGFSHYFKHDDGNHVMTMVDDAENLPAAPAGMIKFTPQQDNVFEEDEHFKSLEFSAAMTTGVVRLVDYNFKEPTAAMEVEHSSRLPYTGGDLESFEYPGDYLERDDGEQKVAKRKAAQYAAGGPSAHAAGPVPTLKSGMSLAIDAMDDHPANGQVFVCVGATHSYSNGAYSSGSEGKDSFSGSFELQPLETPIAPARTIPPKKIYGPQPARVVGDSEIDVDEYGRILVMFPWDLDEAKSMRCRVVQSWAGNGWGGMVIPRKDMEVLVEFVNGDPNFPIVTGCVYNGQNEPPYGLPAEKTRMTLMSKTNEGEGFNEIRFEDADGSEEVFIHAEKDMNIKVEDNATLRVNTNYVESVGDNRASETTNNQYDMIGGDLEMHVGPGAQGRFTPGSASSDTQGIGNVASSFGGSGNGTFSLNVDHDFNTNVTNRMFTEVGTGGAETRVMADTEHWTLSNFKIEAGQKIELICGASRIEMDVMGNITVNGKSMKVTAIELFQVASAMIKLN